MTIRTSRRAILAGAAATAIPATGAVGLPGPANPDADLLALGTCLDGIIQEWKAKSASDWARRSSREQACIDAGLPRRELKEFASADEWRAYLDQRLAVMQTDDEDDEVDEDGYDVVWNDIDDRLYPVVEDILSRTARTTEGLAVQARAWHIGDQQMFDQHYEPDNQSEYGARFLAAVYRFMGVGPLDLSGNAPSAQQVAS